MGEKLTKREIEEMKEEWRKEVKENVARHAKANSSNLVRRFVDREVIEKTVLHQYGKFKQARRKAEYSDEALNRMHHSQTFDGQHFMVCDVPLNMSIEEQYLNTFGTGIDGRAVPTAMHQAVFCPHCHLKYVGDLACQDLRCPRCGTLTPIGKLVIEEKAYKKW